MKLAICGAAWALMLISTATADDAKPSAAAESRAREQAERTVKRALGSLSEGLFVVAMGEATLPQAGEGGRQKGEGGERPKNGGRPAEGARNARPQVAWQFQVIEGRDAAASAIVNHMSAGTQTNPRDWRFVQRFKTNEREKADAAVAQLQNQPSREGEGKGKGEGEGKGKAEAK